MKNIYLSLFLLLLSSNLFSQSIRVDSVSMIKPGSIEPSLDSSITNHLEPFLDKNDLVIYMYRMPSFVGAAVKWPVACENSKGKIGQRQYVVFHLSATKKSHWLKQKSMLINYTNFKPNTYYFYRLEGFAHSNGYLDPKSYDEFKTYKKVPLDKK